MTPDLQVALELADVAAEIAMKRFRAEDLEVVTKPDGSPVTDADRAVEEALRLYLAERFPGDGVLGEEFGGEVTAGRCWILDPIDGTNRYLAGETGWATFIALQEAWEIVAGVASFPADGRRIWAEKGAGAYDNGKRIRVSQVASLSEATVMVAGFKGIKRLGLEDRIRELERRCRRMVPYEATLGYLGVTNGEVDALVDSGGHLWDYAPIKIGVEEAGGRFTDLWGIARADSGHQVSSNGLIHEEILAVFKNGQS